MFNIKKIYRKKINYLEKIAESFNVTEKTIAIILSLIAILSCLSLIWKVNLLFVTNVPARGGNLTEGLIGSARFINPLLELSDADRDLTYLIYSGLMRASAEGDLTTDLADNYNISDDGLTYTFKIRNDAYFHDGKKVTADDIKYTIQMAQDISLRSPKRNNWIGVEVEKINDLEIAFHLKQPFSPFLENTTLGILPKHIWSQASTDEFPLSLYNIEPIGSGPYKINSIKRNNLGIPSAYELKAFKNYTLGEPYITTINFKFYPNEKDLTSAYLSNIVESTSSFSLQNLSETKNKVNDTAEQISLPRIFGLFFNQNQNKIFLNPAVRQALNITVDKDRIITEALSGFGEKINSPLPNGVLPNSKPSEVFNKEEALNRAREILAKDGWKLNEKEKVLEKVISKNETQRLSFSISTSNVSDLKKVADILKEDWALLNIHVEIQTFELSDLNQSVISQRKYDTLLFGQIINRSLDLFAFWHSSQRNSGYNVAMYTNSKVDKLLEEARQITDKNIRLEKYTQLEDEINKDIPAIFIYTPEFIYILPQKISGFKSGLINNRSERFEEVHNWYINTNRIWNFLIPKK